MTVCKLSIYLAYGMLLYTFASIYYLLMTRNIGTPFNDSLTIEQLRIKKESVDVRKRVFYMGLTIGIIVCIIFQPFKAC